MLQADIELRLEPVDGYLGRIVEAEDLLNRRRLLPFIVNRLFAKVQGFSTIASVLAARTF